MFGFREVLGCLGFRVQGGFRCLGLRFSEGLGFRGLGFREV